MHITLIFLTFALLLVGCVALPSTSRTSSTTGDVERGAQLFAQGQGEAPPCSTCHRVIDGQVGFSVGPNLAGIAERADTWVTGSTTQEYLRQSIVDPGRHIVSGYRNIMYLDYGTHLTEQNIQDLIAYLVTL